MSSGSLLDIDQADFFYGCLELAKFNCTIMAIFSKAITWSSTRKYQNVPHESKTLNLMQQ